MFTIRSLVAVVLTSLLTGPVTAQEPKPVPVVPSVPMATNGVKSSPPDTSGGPVRSDGPRSSGGPTESGGPAKLNAVTLESLGAVLKAKYPKELQPATEKPLTFYTLKLQYYPPKSKTAMNWTVSCEVREPAGQAAMVRIWFNCQLMTEKANPDRLRSLIDWSGGHDVSRAYFKTANHKEGKMLSLVVDVPAEDVTADRFTRVMDALLLMAFDTSGIWGDLDKPLVTTPAKPAIAEKDILGAWSGKVILDDKEVGQYSVTFSEGGFLLVSRANTTVEKPQLDINTGGFKIVNGQLVISMDKSAVKEEVYDINLNGKKLTLTMKQNKSVLKLDLTSSK